MLENERTKLKEESEHPTIKVADQVTEVQEPESHLQQASDSIPEPARTPDAASENVAAITEQIPPAQKQETAAASPLSAAVSFAGEPSSGLAEQELRGLAMLPDTPETEWLKACAELNRREQKSSGHGAEKHPPKASGWPVVIADIVIIAGAALATWFYFAHTADRTSPVKESKTSQVQINNSTQIQVNYTAPLPENDTTKDTQLHVSSPTPYMENSVRFQKLMLLHRARALVANAIAENDWSDAQAAANLHVSQGEISDLMRANPVDLSLDKLTEMLMLMGKSPALIYPGDKTWRYSMPLPTGKGFEEEIAYLTRAIHLGNKSEDVYEQRAFVHDELREYDLAIADYNHCLELEPNNSRLLEMRGEIHSESGAYQAALSDMNEAMRRTPNYDAYQNRSIVYQNMGDYKNALKDCNEAIARMKTPRPGPYSNRAMVEEKLGMTREAIADYRDALKSDPSYKRALEKIPALEKKLNGD